MSTKDTRDCCACADQKCVHGVRAGSVSSCSSAMPRDGEERVGRSEATPGPDDPSLYLESRQKYCPQEDRNSGAAQEFDSYVEIHPCRCKSRFCKHCCEFLGDQLRKKLIPVLSTFRNIQMWTFTIDPKLFDSPEQAFRYAKQRRAVSRTINRLHALGYLESNRWFCVVEWQKNGMPHFHVLLDSVSIPFNIVCDIWNAFRPDWAGPVQGTRPGFGSIRFSALQHNFDGPEHAAFYACKYLTKHPKCGYPSWVLDFKGRIRRYETSRGFWGDSQAKVAIEERETPAKKVVKKVKHLDDCFCAECRGDEPVKKRPQSTIRERIQKCRDDAVALRVTQTLLPGGELFESKDYVQNLNAPFWKVARLLGQKTPKSGPLVLTQKELERLEVRLMIEGAS